MKYHVYRFREESPVWVATTRYREDANRVFDQWNRAYIVTDDGEIIVSKGVE